MDRRVFQPRPDSGAERRRSAIGMSLLVLVGSGLWLLLHHPSVTTPPPAARSVPKD